MAATAPAFSHLDPLRQQIARDKARERIREIRGRAESQLAQIMQEVQKRTKLSMLEDIPPAFEIFKQSARYKGAKGGRGSAKSWSFAKLLVRRCKLNPGTRWVCIREIQKSLKESVKQLLEDQIKLCGLETEFRVLETHIETPGDGVIIFQGMQNHTATSIKSLEGYDGAWVEEAQSLSARSLTLLRPTIRKETCRHCKKTSADAAKSSCTDASGHHLDPSEIWFTWNPEKPDDPVDTLLCGEQPPPDAIVREVTYKDNPHFGGVLQREMEYDKSQDLEKYNHVWLGGYQRHSAARVFKNVVVEDFDTPADAVFLYGGDWGFATDPDVLVRGFLRGLDFYIDQEVYRIGCEIDDTPALFDSIACTKDHIHDVDMDRAHRAVDKRGVPIPTCDAVARPWQIITDSARPETISYMQRHGYPRVIAAKKGPGSVEEGIKFLKSFQRIVVHKRCKHTADEFVGYCFKTDPLTNQIIPVLQDKKNHVIDSVRYSAENVRNPPVSFVTW